MNLDTSQAGDAEGLQQVNQICTELQKLLIQYPEKTNSSIEGLQELVSKVWNEVHNDILDDALYEEDVETDAKYIDHGRVASKGFGSGTGTEHALMKDRRHNMGRLRGNRLTMNNTNPATSKEHVDLGVGFGRRSIAPNPTALNSKSENDLRTVNANFYEPSIERGNDRKARRKRLHPQTPSPNFFGKDNNLFSKDNAPKMVHTNNNNSSNILNRKTNNFGSNSSGGGGGGPPVLKRGISANTILQKMLPEKVINQLMSGANVCAEHFDKVSILFADIVGFTSMASQVSPFELFALLNDIYLIIDKLVDKHLLYKVETIGDCYMVVGGAHTLALEPHVAVARMALELVASFTGKKGVIGDQPIEFCLGIHTGPVLGGIVGAKMPRYCFFGDVVNTASRMQSTSLHSRVQVSESTYETLKNRFQFETRGVLNIKGKGQMQTYFLVGENAPMHCWPVFKPRGPEHGHNPHSDSHESSSSLPSYSHHQEPKLFSKAGRDEQYGMKMEKIL